MLGNTTVLGRCFTTAAHIFGVTISKYLTYDDVEALDAWELEDVIGNKANEQLGHNHHIASLELKLQ